MQIKYFITYALLLLGENNHNYVLIVKVLHYLPALLHMDIFSVSESETFSENEMILCLQYNSFCVSSMNNTMYLCAIID